MRHAGVSGFVRGLTWDISDCVPRLLLAACRGVRLPDVSFSSSPGGGLLQFERDAFRFRLDRHGTIYLRNFDGPVFSLASRLDIPSASLPRKEPVGNYDSVPVSH